MQDDRLPKQVLAWKLEARRKRGEPSEETGDRESIKIRERDIDENL